MSKLIVVAREQTGVYGKIGMILARSKVKIVNCSIKNVDQGSKQYTFLLNNKDGKPLDAVQQLTQINGVITAEIDSSQSTTNNSDQIKQYLEQLKHVHPDIVGTVRKIMDSLPPDNAHSMLYSLGYEYSIATFNPRHLKLMGTIPLLIDQLIVPVISEYSIAGRRGDWLVVELCPFCRNSLPHITHCSFLHGVIKGILKVGGDVPSVEVKEQSSQSDGKSECAFLLERQA